jgi:hypothetical protein
MPGIFDRLQKQIEDKQSEGGITALDLADLAPALRKIMRMMLRELQLSYPEISKAVSSFPDSERLSHIDLVAALDTLTHQAWLLRLGEGEKAIYKVNLRRKAGSTLASGVWDALDAKLKDK